MLHNAHTYMAIRTHTCTYPKEKKTAKRVGHWDCGAGCSRPLFKETYIVRTQKNRRKKKIRPQNRVGHRDCGAGCMASFRRDLYITECASQTKKKANCTKVQAIGIAVRDVLNLFSKRPIHYTVLTPCLGHISQKSPL